MINLNHISEYNERFLGKPLKVLWCLDDNVDVNTITSIKEFTESFCKTHRNWSFNYDYANKNEDYQFISGTPKIKCVKGHFYKTLYCEDIDIYEGKVCKFYAIIEYDSQSRKEHVACLKRGMINILEEKLAKIRKEEEEIVNRINQLKSK